MTGKINLEPNILIVEDDTDIALLTQTMLQLSGYESTVATNGKEAIKFLSDKRYDLVFMDIQMPVMNGLEATKKIRNGKAGMFNKDIPIVALSSLSNNGIENKCFLAGMNLYLYKPVSNYIIKSTLKTFLTNK
ncbi:MAG: hypothetical protein B6D61_09075 [Bacteroidetes bacterium 4484_249]|nr:MAG: hypothetical protein B6D61_09075 [Bacteroidetes bacterium 4484_249]